MSTNVVVRKVFENLGRTIFSNKKLRTLTIVLNCISIFSGMALLIYFSVYGTKEQLVNFINISSGFFFIIPAVTLLSFMFFAVSVRKSPIDSELEQIHEERKEITKKIESESTHDIFNTIQLSLNQLNEYYTINKGQAKSSFGFSIFAIVIGLLTILVGIWLYYFKIREIQVTYLTSISGVILEFIGGAYFFMYKKSLGQVNFFFGQLIKIQDTMLAINLAKNNSDNDKKSALEEKIIVSLLERSLK